jgi:hypothetical protein
MKIVPTWTEVIFAILFGIIIGFCVGYFSTLHKIDLRAQEIGWMEYKNGQWQYKTQYKYELHYLKYGTIEEK